MKSDLIENKDFYYNQDGLMVLTAAYHVEKGYCCGNGCLHCPYNYEAVPEPLKTYLVKQGKRSSAAFPGKENSE